MEFVKKCQMAMVAAITAVVVSAATFALTQTASAEHAAGEMTAMFQGVKANTGKATHLIQDGKHVLMLSEDFKAPDAPDPHWQVVDSKGNVYLLQKLMVKPDKLNQTIVVPAYVPDVVKVQMWCAWAEVLLGEASFEKPIALASR